LARRVGNGLLERERVAHQPLGRGRIVASHGLFGRVQNGAKVVCQRLLRRPPL
jgi:hypothetical protein